MRNHDQYPIITLGRVSLELIDFFQQIFIWFRVRRALEGISIKIRARHKRGTRIALLVKQCTAREISDFENLMEKDKYIVRDVLETG